MFTTKAFKEAVPIHEYEDLKGYIERMMAGEQNLLWNTPVYWFAKSSGTTSDKSKFIPVSEESLQDGHYKASKDVLSIYYQFYPESELLTGKGLVIGGSHNISPVNSEAQYGDLSAVLLQNSPFWGHWLRTPDLSIALMDEWESKIEALARNTIKENVTSISGVPTWTLVLFRRILEITGKQTISEVWPSLELYMHGGVSFTPFASGRFGGPFGTTDMTCKTFSGTPRRFKSSSTGGKMSKLHDEVRMFAMIRSDFIPVRTICKTSRLRRMRIG